MDGFEGPVEGRNGTWSVGDRAGKTTRWTTYRGTDEEGSPVAIRTPTGTVPGDRYDRFDALARQWGTVDERRTVRGLLDWGTDPEPWVAVEYVPDELEAWATGTTLETARACDPRTRAELLFDVCEVLRTYSRYGSTPCHLALHPDCLSFRVDADGPVAVVDDWGLSRLVEDPPTTPYTAPEQLEGDHASKRTDVYRIGALAAAALGDGSPFPGVDADDPAALADAIRGGIDADALGDEFPEGAVRPVTRATESDPADRYATTYPLGRDLLDAVPMVDTGDREADALAATVAPTPEEPDADEPDAGAEAEDAGAGAAAPATGDDGSDADDPDDGTTESTAAGVDGSGGAGSNDGGADGDGSDGGGSRRSFLKYGVGAFALAGVGVGGLIAMDRNEPSLRAIEDGTGASRSGSESGTGSESETQSEPASEEEAATEITGGTVTVDARYYQWLQDLPEAIDESDVPDAVDVEVRSDTDGSRSIDEILSRIEAGDPKPDVLLAGLQELGPLFSAGATEPLSTHAGDHRIGEVLDRSFPALDTAARHPEDGEVHALPYSFAPFPIVYRKRPFEEAGIDDTDEWMTAPPTWTEWSEMVAAARQNQGFVWTGQPPLLRPAFTGVLGGFGGSYYETGDTAPGDDAVVTIADTPGVRAANVLHDLALGGDRADPPVQQTSSENVLEYGFPEVLNAFRTGEAVAALLPPSIAMDVQGDSEPIGMMPMPTGSVTSRTNLYGQYVVVNPNTELLGEALAVARGFRSEAVGSLLVANGQLPTMNGDPFSIDAASSSPYASHAPAIRFMAENAIVEPPTETWYREQSTIGQVLRRTITDDPRAGLSELASILGE
ncbi:extracellular solute-binding protein [Halorubrum cibi]|uniref:ABC-type glycerol-3-phosphate transport system, substrate-binding protein n=1 Tax=Halorubrum cibi TaxID=413815 RepID=A0A521BL23_9EURY|nr:extracellular solute-binding protein [Halorubrum cibi]SMO47340.1 ABC-type glycerol-3-phosphate transport system, substrate-binding protein [Halorubrum cibi]